ncbi:helix-turn-helix domain-containing protein [Acetobacterium wieringae]|uniref:helix-turn-helix domain-containing protein n=1 Tax=Acetobacterium wieringae TaxID=52694 RepID=UPI002033AC6A|nr:helix-turn-helix transcriptional regulator [Acetobacterium wieringae]URN83518.1 helix-turn-helix domain-containing protein [Acetobacterium wieringae]
MFSDRLKYLRSTEDLTQRDLAFKLGITSGAVGMYESGKRFPDNTILNKIADYFHVSTDYLLGRTDDPLPVRNVDQDFNDELDTESKWLNFLKTLSGDSMFYQYENIDEEQKLAIMDEYKEKLEKKKKKVEKFMDFSDEVIDEALNFAAYNQEQRKKKLDD